MTCWLHEQVGAQFNQHLLSLPGAIPRPRLPMMPMPFIPGMRPPILSTPTAGAAGNMQKKSSESIIWNKKFGKRNLIALLVTSFSYPKVNNWKNMYWNHFFLLLSFLFCFGIIWVIYSELSLLSMLEGICRFGPFMNDVDLHCLLLVWIEVKLKT